MRESITGDDADAFDDRGRFRRWYCSFQRAGHAKKIKTRANRRERRVARDIIRKQRWDER